MGDGLTLALADTTQANGLKITGGANTTLQLNDFTPIANETINASGFGVSKIKLLNVLVAGTNVDLLLAGLPGSVVKEIYNGLGSVSMINQVVTITAGTTVSGGLTFNPITNDTELGTFTLNLTGGTEISAGLNLATTAKVVGGVPQQRTLLDTLTINSTGTATNLLNGKMANTIKTDITSLGGPGQPDLSLAAVKNNNLLKVVINASQALVVQGDVIFSSVVGDDNFTGNDNPSAIATLTVNGSANVTLGAVNTQDDDVDGLTVVNAGTGTLSLTLDATKLDQTVGTPGGNDALSFTGTAPSTCRQPAG